MEKKSGFQSINAANVVPFAQNQKPVELFDLVVEQAVIGAILVDNLKFEQAATYITSDSFYAEAHRRIWEEIKKKIDNGQKASPLSLSPIFKDDELLADSGGAEYLIGIAAESLAPDIEDCARIIRDYHLRRTMLDAVERAAHSIKTNPSLYQSLEPLEGVIQSVATSTGDQFENAKDSWFNTQKRIEATRNGEISTTSTGFKSVDDVLLGLQRGCLYVVAGATGMGKTAFALNIASNIAEENQVLLFSMEMTQSQLQMRQCAAATGVSVQKQIKGNLTDEEMRMVCGFQVNNNLVVVEGGKDLSTLANISKKFVRKFQSPKLIIIDYLQLMPGNPKITQRVYQIEEITRSLKKLAVSLNIPIIILSQLSRTITAREDKRPMLSDLKDSGSIEQDADSVIFVYRHEYYLKRERPTQRDGEDSMKFSARLSIWQNMVDEVEGKAEILIEKNRYGQTGCAKLNWCGHRTQFSEPDFVQEALF